MEFSKFPGFMHANGVRLVTTLGSASSADFGSLKLSTRAELWDGSVVLYFTASCLDALYHVRSVTITSGETDPLFLNINAHVGDAESCCKYPSARLRLRVASRLVDFTEEATEIILHVDACKVDLPDRPSVLENRKRPAGSELITPFGRRSLRNP